MIFVVLLREREQTQETVEDGVKEAMETGVLAGYPMVDVRVFLLDGKYHEVDSSELAFKIAASMGFREAVGKAEPVLLEPVMEVEVVMPESVKAVPLRISPVALRPAPGPTPISSGVVEPLLVVQTVVKSQAGVLVAVEVM